MKLVLDHENTDFLGFDKSLEMVVDNSFTVHRTEWIVGKYERI